jgi:hypothetical protein
MKDENDICFINNFLINKFKYNKILIVIVPLIIYFINNILLVKLSTILTMNPNNKKINVYINVIKKINNISIILTLLILTFNFVLNNLYDYINTDTYIITTIICILSVLFILNFIHFILFYKNLDDIINTVDNNISPIIDVIIDNNKLYNIVINLFNLINILFIMYIVNKEYTIYNISIGKLKKVMNDVSIKTKVINAFQKNISK